MTETTLYAVEVEESSTTLELSALFDAYYKRVYNYIYYRVNNQSESEDLTSLVFEKIMVKQSSYRKDQAPLEVWIFTIARNVINDYFRRKRKIWFLPIENFEQVVSTNRNPEEQLILSEKNMQLQSALLRLKAKERHLVALKFGADLKNTEIAELLNETPNHIGIQLFRIMKKLKNELKGA